MNELSKKEIIDIMEKCFYYGVGYGQVLMEEERESEEFFDAFIGHCIDKKYNSPSHPTERRQAHSEKWFEAKKHGFKNLQKLIRKMNEQI